MQAHFPFSILAFHFSLSTTPLSCVSRLFSTQCISPHTSPVTRPCHACPEAAERRGPRTRRGRTKRHPGEDALKAFRRLGRGLQPARLELLVPATSASVPPAPSVPSSSRHCHNEPAGQPGLAHPAAFDDRARPARHGANIHSLRPSLT